MRARMLWSRSFERDWKNRIAGALLALLLIEAMASIFVDGWLSFFEPVAAAQVTIDATTNTTANRMQFLGSQTVFISDQVGYKFYVDSTGTCSYSKTTNGGSAWGAAVIVDAQTDCFAVAVWYDRWTPGDDTGTNIHIITADTGNDQLWYNRLDSTTDTRLLGTTPVNVSTNSGQTGSITGGANAPSIAKATDGTIYAVISDNTDSYVVRCSVNCNLTTGWTEAGANPMDLQPDWTMIVPLANNNMMLIQRDISADDMRSKVWNNGAGTWDATWTTIDANAPENATYDPQFAAIVDVETNDVYLAYVDNSTSGTIGGNNDSVKTAKYNGTNWNSTANVVTNSALGLTGVAISLDPNSSVVYVAYTGRTTPATATTANVYWATSTYAMTSWGGQQGPVNTTPDDIYAPDLNGFSDQRIFVSWYGATPDDIFGDTLADITPFTIVSPRGTQATELRAGTTNQYLGGQFVITENAGTRNVTSLTIHETGTIDGSADVNNIKLFYDKDTSAPYDCVSESYSGTESQFGTTDTNGFSGENGLSTFTDAITISTTETLCVYVVLDIAPTTPDGSTLEIEITNPQTDVIVTGGPLAIPKTPVRLSGTTIVRDSELTQTHYHWRNDNGDEVAATSRTGGVQDTPLAALQKLTPVRLRVGISNEGSTSTLPTAFRLEYAQNPSTCDAVGSWTDINASSDAFDLFNSSFITDGGDTTNISIASGGVDDENASFLTPNGGLRDTSSQTSPLTLLPTNFVELEFSLQATASVTEGESYCFRVSAAGTSLPVYSIYPQVTIAADVAVSASGTQAVSADVPSTNQYLGGRFVVTENVSSRTVTAITLTDTGTVDAATGLSDIKLYYDYDTSAPYDCVSESYSGTESQFGATVPSFLVNDGQATFSGTASITTTQTLCVYVVYSVTEAASNGNTVDFTIASPATDVVVSGGGSVSPSTVVDIENSTLLSGAVVTQTGYHWRNDDGNEAAATSATGGSENTVLEDFAKQTPVRLRMQLENQGATTSVPKSYGLQYGIKSTSCEAIVVWTSVEANGVSWALYDSPFLTHGDTTTDISVGAGGISNPDSKTFISPNSGVRESSSYTATTTFTTSQYVEYEFSLTTTEDTPNEAKFCFRLTQNDQPLLSYARYAEITIEPRRDFKIQRGEIQLSGASITLTAGVDYDAPSASTSAFVRLTNTYYTGSGNNTGGGTQNARNYTAYIANPGNITTSFTIQRPPSATASTYVSWEIIEYVGPPEGDNEMIVRDQRSGSLANTATVLNGAAVTSVVDDTDVVVFITGQSHRTNSRTVAFAHQFTSAWNAGTKQPVLQRGATGSAIADLSYAVVEFTGVNWRVQRAEHTYVAAGAVETESITAVNSLSKTFLHTQKRFTSGTSQANFSHDVWLSSIGAVSFQTGTNTVMTSNPVSVAWVIENLQVGNGSMVVQRSNGNTNAGVEPLLLGIPIASPLNATNNASIFMTSMEDSTSDAFPRTLAGAFITSTTSYQLWRSETGGGIPLTYRTEIVQWPAANLTIRQNDYRFYTNNNALIPDDPWPIGGPNLGENTPISTADEPMSDGDVVRIRMTARIDNATLPSGFLNVKLQYGQRTSTCGAVAVWIDVGAPGSGDIWRGYDAAGVTDGVALSLNPPTPGDLLIAVADVAGRYVESNPAAANPYRVLRGEDIEYDWVVQQNGANQKTTYCFRMVYADGLPLDAYFDYPQIRTEGYAPATRQWQWFDDFGNETPTNALSSEGIAPNDVDKNTTLKLRVTVAELKNLQQINSRFSIQYSTDPNFTNPTEPVPIGACIDSSVWCYADGAGADNSIISTAVLSTSDVCVGGVGNGCGLRIESNTPANGFTHLAGASLETEFVLRYTNVERNFGKVYYFRLFDQANNEPVGVNSGYTPISIGVESARLSFSVDGLVAGTTVAGVVTTAPTTPATIAFGSLLPNNVYAAAQRLSVTTNAYEGYQVLLSAASGLLNAYGDPIGSLSSSNSSPAAWNTTCALNTNGCFGYHTTDASLANGSARFAPLDSFAGVQPILNDEIMYSSLPASGDQQDILYQVSISALQPAGEYETSISYIAVPVY